MRIWLLIYKLCPFVEYKLVFSNPCCQQKRERKSKETFHVFSISFDHQAADPATIFIVDLLVEEVCQAQNPSQLFPQNVGEREERLKSN